MAQAAYKQSTGECLQAGLAFIAADYTLLGPGTAHDMVRDVKRLFWWIQHELNLELGKHGGSKVSPERVVVAGESAGGYLAYLSVRDVFLIQAREAQMGRREFTPSPSLAQLPRYTGWEVTSCRITISYGRR